MTEKLKTTVERLEAVANRGSRSATAVDDLDLDTIQEELSTATSACEELAEAAETYAYNDPADAEGTDAREEAREARAEAWDLIQEQASVLADALTDLGVHAREDPVPFTPKDERKLAKALDSQVTLAEVVKALTSQGWTITKGSTREVVSPSPDLPVGASDEEILRYLSTSDQRPKFCRPLATANSAKQCPHCPPGVCRWEVPQWTP